MATAITGDKSVRAAALDLIHRRIDRSIQPRLSSVRLARKGLCYLQSVIQASECDLRLRSYSEAWIASPLGRHYQNVDYIIYYTVLPSISVVPFAFLRYIPCRQFAKMIQGTAPWLRSACARFRPPCMPFRKLASGTCTELSMLALHH